MNILITGSSGFLGSHTVRHFRALGHQVTGVDIVAADTTSHVTTTQQFLSNCSQEFDLLVHFAAEVGGRANMETNYLNMIANIELDRVVFEWAQNHVAHIIYPSSSAVYPVDYQTKPDQRLVESMVSFEHSCIGVSDHLYGWSKLTGERMLWQISQETDLQIHILRPFSGYGPGQGLAYPMANLVNIVKNSPNNLEVWGTGQQTRDWVHITDILRTVEWCSKDTAKYTVLNIGTGVATSFLELINQIHTAVYQRPAANIQTRQDRPQGVAHRVADPALQQSLGIMPQVTLAQGILTLI